MRRENFRFYLPLLSLLLSIVTVAAAQEGGEPYSAFQVSFVPGLSTNGLHSYRYTNLVSLNALIGLSQSERGLCLGGVSNIVRNQGVGVQGAGVCNAISQGGKGLVVSGVANVVQRGYRGMQLAGVGNIGDTLHGVQLASVVNVARDVVGFQGAGVCNVARRVKGVQMALLVNVAEECEYPIGIVNVIGNGQYGVALQYDDWGTVQAVLRSGREHTYGVVGLGLNPSVGVRGIATVGGWGYRTRVSSWMRLAHELTGQSLGMGSRFVFRAGYSLMPLMRISEHWEAFGAVGLFYGQAHGMLHEVLMRQQALWRKQSPTVVRQLQVGYQLGIQYTF